MSEDDFAPPPTRLVNFVSEEQLAEARKTRGARVDDGTGQRDRSLYEILKENKDKRDAEFNERFKHRPPKALDEDETEFLDKLEMSRREYDRQMADDEAYQLRSFQAAVAAQSAFNHELKETPPASKVQEQKLVGKKNPLSRPLGMNIIVKPQKKAKTDMANAEESLDAVKSHVDTDKSFIDLVKPPSVDGDKSHVLEILV
ncbi:Protein FAM192A like [Actinidia chinensis var. chinensis]|uniref:Protein FAM192A like n=1 Tax=Actinidia chinensis var. chinensis TaxID=1590841 RepID=A0A2R6PNQ0_ACTCC|nr:Protein FAM192A like [Actinidia chinensis var. chinensis]